MFFKIGYRNINQSFGGDIISDGKNHYLLTCSNGETVEGLKCDKGGFQFKGITVKERFKEIYKKNSEEDFDLIGYELQ